MHVTVVHNPTAGDGDPSAAALLAALSEAGYQPAYCSTKADDLDECLRDPGSMVVVAGGDGTVHDVAIRLAGRPIPLAVIALGTANNISRSLGIRGGVLEQIRGWPAARRCRLDVGCARGRWGERRFVEGVGFGPFPMTIAQEKVRKKAGTGEELSPRAELRHARQVLAQAVRECPPIECRVTLDDRELNDTFAMIEVLNTPRIGPKLELATSVDPGDRMLSVVLIPEADRGALAELVAQPASEPPAASPFPPMLARRVRIEGAPKPVHIDDEVWPEKPGRSGAREPMSVEIELAGLAVDVLVPAWHARVPAQS